MRSWTRESKLAALAALAIAIGAACGDSKGTGSQSTGTGGAGGTGGASTGGGSVGGDDGGFLTSSSSSSSGGDAGTCATPCNPQTQVCSHGTCVPLMPCTSDDQCENDTRCDPTMGCVPWDQQVPPNDPACVNVIPAGVLQPTVRCQFNAAPASDPFPQHLDVQSTPLVVNFNNPGNFGPPSIVAAFTANVPGNYTEDLGILRVLRGTDCSLEANLGGVDADGGTNVEWLVSSSTPAVGDLDGDGAADVVAYGADGSTVAFTRKSGTWQILWKAPYPAGAPWTPCDTTMHRCSIGWAGPAIHDLDDDGKPEVIREGVVFGSDGTLKSLAPTGYQSYSQGLFPVVANLDQDPLIEMTNGRYVWKWMSGAWVTDTQYAGPASPGQAAVADFGAYGTGVPSSNPEIAVVANNTVAVYAITGEMAMPPVTVPGSGGGPFVIADFDGDGLPEIGIAGKAYYTVYDIDCGPNPRPGGKCSQGPCDYVTGGACPANGYIAWSRQTQDISSNVTGSSVFDFEADGTAEVVYADECFVRVYNGKTGEVEFSQYHSSCTWYENPVVADVDGNFRADLVVPSNEACTISCASLLDANGVDKLFAGLHCKVGTDCASGQCDNGLCRCTATADCCAAHTDADCLEDGYSCVPPPAGTAGTGNTCRAAHPHSVQGIRVYSDANDKWVRSRTIWNQHPYAVTNVNEDGTIPKSSLWQNNWQQPGLNNFRQNVPGTPNGLATGDATAGASTTYTCSPSGAALSVPVCDRGQDPIGAGLVVGFYVAGTKVCSTTTTAAIPAGQCLNVACTWATPPADQGQAVDVDVIADDGGGYQECKTGNDHGTVLGVYCKPAQ